MAFDIGIDSWPEMSVCLFVPFPLAAVLHCFFPFFPSHQRLLSLSARVLHSKMPMPTTIVNEHARQGMNCWHKFINSQVIGCPQCGVLHLMPSFVVVCLFHFFLVFYLMNTTHIFVVVVSLFAVVVFCLPALPSNLINCRPSIH